MKLYENLPANHVFFAGESFEASQAASVSPKLPPKQPLTDNRKISKEAKSKRPPRNIPSGLGTPKAPETAWHDMAEAKILREKRVTLHTQADVT